MKHILARVDGSPGDSVVLDYALQIARLFGAHVEVVHCKLAVGAGDAAAVQISAHGGGIDAVVIDAANTIGQNARSNFENWLKANSRFEGESGPDGVDFAFREYPGWEPDIIAPLTRLTDLTIVARGDAAASTALETALQESHRPVLLVPCDGRIHDLTYRPIVAWNESVEASSAVFGALPILQKCRETVEVFTAPEGKHSPSPQPLITYLRLRSIIAASAIKAGHRLTIAEQLLSQAATANSGMLIAGAYSHGALHQLVFGGVTRHILDHAKIPLMLAR